MILVISATARLSDQAVLLGSALVLLDRLAQETISALQIKHVSLPSVVRNQTLEDFVIPVMQATVLFLVPLAHQVFVSLPQKVRARSTPNVLHRRTLALRFRALPSQVLEETVMPRTSPTAPSSDLRVPLDHAFHPVELHVLQMSNVEDPTRTASTLLVEPNQLLEDFVIRTMAVIATCLVPLVRSRSVFHQVEAAALPTRTVLLR